MRLKALEARNPRAAPINTPTVMFTASETREAVQDATVPEAKPRTVTVRNTAIGSLLPDSSSSRGFRSPFSFTRRDRIIAKTAAASVEDTIEPSRSPSKSGKPRTNRQKSPTRRAVMATPKVARIMLRPSTGRTLSQSVSRPPENRMKARAKTPTELAATGSLK
ncbi:MAG: hypothetical protein BWX47_01529 [candidate division Hyd24-12 bacterium ADurb.Bin004]|nr:MAG: hypothetical protein BWX47_01529 [candidate division Hyd24-12 bacterium ADurb.Bin004]